MESPLGLFTLGIFFNLKDPGFFIKYIHITKCDTFYPRNFKEAFQIISPHVVAAYLCHNYLFIRRNVAVSRLPISGAAATPAASDAEHLIKSRLKNANFNDH